MEKNTFCAKIYSFYESILFSLKKYYLLGIFCLSLRKHFFLLKVHHNQNKVMQYKNCKKRKKYFQVKNIFKETYTLFVFGIVLCQKQKVLLKGKKSTILNKHTVLNSKYLHFFFFKYFVKKKKNIYIRLCNNYNAISFSLKLNVLFEFQLLYISSYLTNTVRKVLIPHIGIVAIAVTLLSLSFQVLQFSLCRCIAILCTQKLSHCQNPYKQRQWHGNYAM